MRWKHLLGHVVRSLMVSAFTVCVCDRSCGSPKVTFGAQGEGLTLGVTTLTTRISFMGGVNLGIKEVVKRNQLVYGLEHLL